jgi:GH43 family beta-xylosidase
MMKEGNHKKSMMLIFSMSVTLLLVLSLFQSVVFAGGSTYYNPIKNIGNDPWVVYHDGYYYLVESWDGGIWVWKSPSKSLTRIESAGTKVKVWTPPKTGPNSAQIWAPELHFINNKWYIYYAASDGLNENHRMFVLEGTSLDPQGSYVDKGKISDPTDKWAIDGSVLTHPDGSLYFIWSGWPGDTNGVQNLYIAPMSDPWTISGERVLISTPEYDWEKKGGDGTSAAPWINEGPTAIIKNGSIHIVYSASGSWTDDYCLGLLTNTNGNVLDPLSWSKKSTPVFQKTSEVFGPGHASFVKSPDGTEDWIVYHSARTSGSEWDRIMRTQKFTWNSDDTPNFGSPTSPTVRSALPSGEPILETFSWGDSASGTAEFGNWTHNSASSADSETLGGAWFHTFRGDVSLSNYTVQADVKWVETGTVSAYPKYGIYAAYKDSNNYVVAFLDKKHLVFTSSAVVDGVAQTWQNSRLPGSFKYENFNTMKVVKTNSTFDFYVNGSKLQTRTFNISNGQTGLVAEDTKADYANVSVQ